MTTIINSHKVEDFGIWKQGFDEGAEMREKLGIIIESAEIADAMKKIYELAWAEAKRLDKEIKNS